MGATQPNRVSERTSGHEHRPRPEPRRRGASGSPALRRPGYRTAEPAHGPVGARHPAAPCASSRVAAATLAVLLVAIAVWPPLTLGRSSPPLGPGAVTLHLPDRIQQGTAGFRTASASHPSGPVSLAYSSAKDSGWFGGSTNVLVGVSGATGEPFVLDVPEYSGQWSRHPCLPDRWPPPPPLGRSTSASLESRADLSHRSEEIANRNAPHRRSVCALGQGARIDRHATTSCAIASSSASMESNFSVGRMCATKSTATSSP